MNRSTAQINPKGTNAGYEQKSLDALQNLANQMASSVAAQVAASAAQGGNNGTSSSTIRK